jgi:hypothetical protein
MNSIIRNKQTGEFCHFSPKGNAFAIRGIKNDVFTEIDRGHGDRTALDKVWTQYQKFDKAPRVRVEDVEFWWNYLNDLQNKNGSTVHPVQGQEVRRNETRSTLPPPYTGYNVENDDFVKKAVQIVEKSLDKLIKEFLETPYLHRVEHSLHAHFINILTQNAELTGKYEIGSTGEMTQLIHKEWPETTPRPEKGARRGNFDISILSPDLLKSCASIDAFDTGRLPAQIVIEFGLKYAWDHLAGDKAKLKNSNPKHGYLVHLVRDDERDQNAEKIILANDAPSIKTAYAYVSRSMALYKNVNDTSIQRFK